MKEFPFSSRIVVILAAIVFLVGCETMPLGTGVDFMGKPVYLTSEAELSNSLNSWVQPESEFWKTDDAKIQYLLKRVRVSPYTFVRNGSKYDGATATRFLAQKSNSVKWRHRFTTVQEFVDVICSGSSTSGKPYELITQDDTRHNVHFIIQNELNRLEKYLTLQNQKIYNNSLKP